MLAPLRKGKRQRSNRTRRPKTSPHQITDGVKEQALGVRAALESSGLDYGPISVHDKMRAMGLDQVPSTASLARIFRQAGVARLEPRNPGLRGGGLSIQRRTRAGNSTPPNMSSPAVVHA